MKYLQLNARSMVSILCGICLILFVGCRNDKISPITEKTKLVNFLCLVIITQLREYEIATELPPVNRSMLGIVEENLQLNLLRAIYLKSSPDISSDAFYQLEMATKRARKLLQSKPIRLYWINANEEIEYDFMEDEPILPRKVRARAMFIQEFGLESIKPIQK